MGIPVPGEEIGQTVILAIPVRSGITWGGATPIAFMVTEIWAGQVILITGMTRVIIIGLILYQPGETLAILGIQIVVVGTTLGEIAVILDTQIRVPPLGAIRVIPDIRTLVTTMQITTTPLHSTTFVITVM